MKIKISQNANINYLAKIVNIKEFISHPNPEVTKLKYATVDGFNILVGIDSEVGTYVYFPIGCTINSNFLSYCNLYRHKELNSNPNESGMFEDSGRVKAIKLKGFVSEGFLLPVVMLENFILSVTNKELEYNEGEEFDVIAEGDKEFWIVKKYIIRVTVPTSSNNKRQNKVKKLNKVIDTQFRFHYDTIVIKKCPHVITPDSWIHISSKVHGTSGISAYVLCLKENPRYSKIAAWIWQNILNKTVNFFTRNNYKFKLYDTYYDYIYASRTVVKNPEYNPNVTSGYYEYDIWVEADKIIRPKLEKGMTAYYEIIGFLPNGGYIQKGYDYGYSPKSEPIYGETFGIRIYRLTYTNVDGIVHEFSPREVQIWSKEHDLIPVTELYYGKAEDLYPDLERDLTFSEKFIERLSNDKNFYMECNSPECNNKVPHEGVVIRIDDMKPIAFKLKCFKFLNKEQEELDKGQSNIEDNA